MIPNRAPQPKTSCLTMLCYQQMPMVPEKPSNADQRRVAAATPHKSPDQSMPKKIGRPRGAVKAKQKCADPRKQAAATLSANHTKRINKQVAELFRHGPLTVAMIQRALKLSCYQSAGRKVFDWKNRGLIEIVEGPKLPGNGRNNLAKWWGLVNAKLTGASGAVAAKRPVE